MRLVAVTSSCKEISFSSTSNSGSVCPLPQQGREKREPGIEVSVPWEQKREFGHEETIIRRYMFALKIILPVVCSSTPYSHMYNVVSLFSTRTEQFTHLAHQTRNMFDVRRLSNFVFMMILSVAITQKFNFALKNYQI